MLEGRGWPSKSKITRLKSVVIDWLQSRGVDVEISGYWYRALSIQQLLFSLHCLTYLADEPILDNNTASYSTIKYKAFYWHCFMIYGAFPKLKYTSDFNLLLKAKIIRKSVILFWFLNMTIWYMSICPHVHMSIDIETKFQISYFGQQCRK